MLGTKCLRIAVVERKPARLYLHHNPVPRQKYVIGGWEDEIIQERFVWCYRLGNLKALPVSSPKDVHRYRQFISAHLRLAGHFVGKDVDQLYDPVAIGAARGSDEVCDGRTADAQRRRQWRSDITQHIRAIHHGPLIGDKPALPHRAVRESHGAGHIRDGLRRIGDILVKGRTRLRVAFNGGRERKSGTGGQIKRPGLDGTAALTRQGPGFQTVPVVLTRVVNEHRRCVRLRRSILQILIEERLQHVAPKLVCGVALPPERSKRVAVIVYLAVPPRPHDEKIHVVEGVFGLDRQVTVDRTPHVLLVPQALKPHRRHL